jgi:hypothetical protein
MRPEQLTRLEALRDSLVERALIDADPKSWVAGNKSPKDMTRDERGDAKWCRQLAINTLSLAFQASRLLENRAAGGAIVPTAPDGETAAQAQAEEDPIQAEVARFEAAAAEVLAARAVRTARSAKPKR